MILVHDCGRYIDGFFLKCGGPPDFRLLRQLLKCRTNGVGQSANIDFRWAKMIARRSLMIWREKVGIVWKCKRLSHTIVPISMYNSDDKDGYGMGRDE